MSGGPHTPPEGSLDPQDWAALRAQGHRMLDDMFDHLQGRREGPVWRAPAADAVARLAEPLPRRPADLAQTHAGFLRDILPFDSGNTHPGFMGWVQGAGTAVGMLAEMAAAGMNANLGGRHHMAIKVEQQVVGWTREMFGFPDAATGLFLTGTSQANFVALLIARTRALGAGVRFGGLASSERRLVAYTSAAAHGCIAKAMDMAGIGAGALRSIAVGADHRMDLSLLVRAIADDRRAGLTPFLIVGTAGTVDTGAIDNLDGLADIAAAEGLPLHVDGAFGALAVLSPELAPKLAGLERADSIAFDFHKWAQVPYDAGFLLVRDGALHRAAFATEAAYLSRGDRGLAGGDWWPCDYGPDLSRGFRALKTWFTLKTYGAAALGATMARQCALAADLAGAIEAEAELELLAPVALNIVCFRYRGLPGAAPADLDALNTELILDLQEGGVVAPSQTTIAGVTAIRAALFNHRTDGRDTLALVRETLRLGRKALTPLKLENAA